MARSSLFVSSITKILYPIEEKISIEREGVSSKVDFASAILIKMWGKKVRLEGFFLLNEARKRLELNARRDMPKIQIITDPKVIAAYGGDRMYFAPPIDYDRTMRRYPSGKLLTVGDIRSYLARRAAPTLPNP